VDIRAALIACAALLPALPAVAQQAESPVDVGRRTYTASCARCHGINLVASGYGFDLRTFPSTDRARFDRALKEGLRAMPALGASLTAQQQDAIWAYMGSVNGWSAKAP
jgi:mono/diheme cytochrome c family protein